MLRIEILEEDVRVRTIIYKTLCNQHQIIPVEMVVVQVEMLGGSQRLLILSSVVCVVVLLRVVLSKTLLRTHDSKSQYW